MHERSTPFTPNADYSGLLSSVDSNYICIAWQLLQVNHILRCSWETLGKMQKLKSKVATKFTKDYICKIRNIMKNTTQYIVDNRGIKTSVIVPFDKWEKINNDYAKLQKKLEVFLAIRDGLSEIKTAAKHGKKLQTLSDFVNESNR